MLRRELDAAATLHSSRLKEYNLELGSSSGRSCVRRNPLVCEEHSESALGWQHGLDGTAP